MWNEILSTHARDNKQFPSAFNRRGPLEQLARQNITSFRWIWIKFKKEFSFRDHRYISCVILCSRSRCIHHFQIPRFTGPNTHSHTLTQWERDVEHNKNSSYVGELTNSHLWLMVDGTLKLRILVLLVTKYVVLAHWFIHNVYSVHAYILARTIRFVFNKVVARPLDRFLMYLRKIGSFVSHCACYLFISMNQVAASCCGEYIFFRENSSQF